MSPADKLPGPMLGRRENLQMTAAVASVGLVRVAALDESVLLDYAIGEAGMLAAL